MDDFKEHIIEDSLRIRRIAGAAHRVAVIGMRPSTYADRPAYYVPKYLMDAGLQIYPVPVHGPQLPVADQLALFGGPTYARVADVPPILDIIVVFRRSADVSQHLDDLLAARPRCVWLQSGIRNDDVAEALAKAGISVVQDHCLMVEHRASRAM